MPSPRLVPFSVLAAAALITGCADSTTAPDRPAVEAPAPAPDAGTGPATPAPEEAAASQMEAGAAAAAEEIATLEADLEAIDEALTSLDGVDR